MTRILRTDSGNTDFAELVKKLDEYLAVTDGDEHAFYDQFNKIDKLKNVIVIYENDKPVGCGAIKAFDAESVEVKRMFVLPEMRGKKIATRILEELENWAREIGYKNCVLETGKRQKEAVALYKKCTYSVIPNYGQYKGMENSLCFKKEL